MALGERMSHSEPRKPLHFPQGGRKEERAKRVKGGQMQRKKGGTKCVPNEKRRQDEKNCFPAVLHCLLKGLSAAAAPLFFYNSAANNTHGHRTGQSCSSGGFSLHRT